MKNKVEVIGLFSRKRLALSNVLPFPIKKAPMICPKCDRQTKEERCPNCGFYLKDIASLADEMTLEFL